jgi:hypothetical protein
MQSEYDTINKTVHVIMNDLFIHSIQIYISFVYLVDKIFGLIVILLQMSHVVCRLLLYTKNEEICTAAYISEM